MCRSPGKPAQHQLGGKGRLAEAQESRPLAGWGEGHPPVPAAPKAEGSVPLRHQCGQLSREHLLPRCASSLALQSPGGRGGAGAWKGSSSYPHPVPAVAVWLGTTHKHRDLARVSLV